MLKEELFCFCECLIKSCVITRNSRHVLLQAFQILPEFLVRVLLEVVITMLSTSLIFSCQTCCFQAQRGLQNASSWTYNMSFLLCFVLECWECNAVFFSIRSHCAHISEVSMGQDNSCQHFTTKKSCILLKAIADMLCYCLARTVMKIGQIRFMYFLSLLEYLRKFLEAILDVGLHVEAKKFSSFTISVS